MTPEEIIEALLSREIDKSKAAAMIRQIANDAHNGRSQMKVTSVSSYGSSMEQQIILEGYNDLDLSKWKEAFIYRKY
jgi:hypothetical protein